MTDHKTDETVDPDRAEIAVTEKTKFMSADKNQHKKTVENRPNKHFSKWFDGTKFQRQPLFFTEIDKSQLFGLRK